MIAALRRHSPARAVLITECSMADNVCGEFPETEFVRPCNLCPHMQSITLPAIRLALATLHPAIDVAPDVAAAARRSIERMFELTVRRTA
jgi:quinolinate synthase